jgi:predicted MPP superfamily phosphohydrolase
VFFSLVGASHYYVWARLVRDLDLPNQAQRALTVVLVALFLALLLSLFVGRSLPQTLRTALLVPAFSWLGTLWLLLVCLLVADVARAAISGMTLLARANASASLEVADGSRRVFLSRLFGGAAVLLAGGASGFSLLTGLRGARVRKVEIALGRLPAGLSGTKIVQLSDLHIGPTLGKAFVDHVVSTCNALQPDVIAITGDLIDGSVEQMGELVAPLAGLQARYGVYFVTGNHEYYSGPIEWCQFVQNLGIRVLRNERVSIGEGENSFDLCGIDDHHAERFGHGHGADLPRACAGRDPSRSLVLLAHQPVQALGADAHGVELQLSGHTHGGQLWPFNYLVKLQQPVVAGLGRVGGTQVYVNSGTGYWGPPMRLGTVSEITEIVLRAPAASA